MKLDQTEFTQEMNTDEDKAAVRLLYACRVTKFPINILFLIKPTHCWTPWMERCGLIAQRLAVGEGCISVFLRQ